MKHDEGTARRGVAPFVVAGAFLSASCWISCQFVVSPDEPEFVVEVADLSAGPQQVVFSLRPDASNVCSEYCTTVQQNCTGVNQVYKSEASCLAMCQHMDPGDEPEAVLGESGTNTVACRLTYAQAAGGGGEEAAENNCPQAGPGGQAVRRDSGECSSNCEGLCLVLSGLCDGQQGLLSQVPDAGALSLHERCLVECSGASVNHEGYRRFFDGEDSVQCRLLHLEEATVDPAHCFHAAGGPPCVGMGRTL